MNNNYIKPDNKNIQNEILEYKEFAINQIELDINSSKQDSYIDKLLNENNILNLTNYQNFVQNFINPNTEYNRLLLLHNTGSGKCHKIDTPILMFDGTISKVQYIKKNDLIMGDDSKSRKIISLSRGKDIMYEINNEYGESYIVNSDHILSLKYDFDKILDISIKDYIKLDNNLIKKLKGYRVMIEFKEKKLSIDPYLIGYNLSKTKSIPYIYKCNSKHNRIQLITGLINYYKSNIIPHINNNLTNDIIFLSRSLGYVCYKLKTNIYILNNNDLTYNITVTKLTEDNYYGFEINGNHRYVMGDFTVTHNSITALSVATNFIKMYKINKSITNMEIGKVFILGFTSNIFKKELLNNEYFGILNNTEINEFQRAKSMINTNLEQDMQYLKELQIRYNKRIKKYYNFIGYKEFYNKLFITENNNINSYNEYEIINNIKLGNIKINKELLLSFKNSLIICDECHNLYNSLEQNNWGISIQIVLDYFNNEQVNGYNSVRCLFLSATPLTNNPIEVISIINLLSNVDNKIKKKDIFKKGKITNDGMNIIKKSIIGKISYLQYQNIEFYPSSEYIGETIENIPYLKFIKCPMSPLHFETYKHLSNIQSSKSYINTDTISNSVSEREEYLISEEIKKNSKCFSINLALENRYLLDYVIPNPESSKFGLYNSNDIKNKIQSASNVWKNKYEINIFNNQGYTYLNGGFLKKENIKKYSTKYYNLLEQIKDIIINKSGKIFIYHNYVNNSGIIFIQNLLKENGILDENSNSVSNTLCTFCYKKRKDHDNNKLNHYFKPIRYVVISGEINNNIIDHSINKFNLSSNKYGDDYKIIIGSKAIKEGYDLKGIQNVIILHPPDNISTLKQILGRSIRNRSHIDLPKEKQNVNIYIYISTIPITTKKYIYSFEELLYKKKIEIYNVIKDIENIFYKYAVDYLINSNLNNNNNLNNKLININNLKLDTFNAYHIDNEIKFVKIIIKRLFIELSNIFLYEDLLYYVKNPPFKININTKLISDDSFIIGLNELLYQDTNVNYIKSEVDSVNLLVSSLYDNNNKIFIDIYNNKVTIIFINNIYMLIQVKDSYNLYNDINIDIEDYYHTNNNDNNNNIKINIDEYIKNNKLLDNFEIDKTEFIEKYTYILSITDTDKYIDELINSDIIYNYNIDFQIKFIEHIIEYLFIIYTSKANIQQNINHNFYIMLLSYYNIFNIIIFANNINLSNEIKKLYNEYTIKSILTKNNKQEDNKNYTISLIYNSTEFINKKNKNIKIFDNLLPIGHLMNVKPIFYEPNISQFVDDLYYKDNNKYIDNQIIVGSQHIHLSNIIFKLLQHTNKVKLNDKRNIETGVVCLYKDKKKLIEICKKLNIELKDVKITKINLCKLIHNELIIREFNERLKNKKIKWFYFLNQ